MKRNILSSLVCGVVTLLAPYAFAQGAATSVSAPSSASPECPPGKCEGMWLHHRQHELHFLTKNLNLTPTQQSQIKGILENRYAQCKALHENASMRGAHRNMSEGERKQKMKEIFRETHEKIMAILTPEQKEKMKQIRKHHMEKEESASNCSDPNCSNSMCPTASSVPTQQ